MQNKMRRNETIENEMPFVSIQKVHANDYGSAILHPISI